MAWYWLMGLGFCTAIYVTSARIRHVVHAVTVKILRAIIWILHKTDRYYEELEVAEGTPETKPAEIPAKYNGHKAVEASQEDITKWLKNKELTVSERK